MPAKKKAAKAKSKSTMPTNNDAFKKAGYHQTESGRWVKDLKAYNEKVRQGLIDPKTGRRTSKGGGKAVAKKATKAKAKKAKAKKPAAKKATSTEVAATT